MRKLPPDPEVIAAAVGLGLVCIFIANVLRLLLSFNQYIPAAALLGIVVGVLVYFDGIRKRPA